MGKQRPNAPAGHSIWDFFRGLGFPAGRGWWRARRRPRGRQPGRPVTLEVLEDRTVPAPLGLDAASSRLGTLRAVAGVGGVVDAPVAINPSPTPGNQAVFRVLQAVARPLADNPVLGPAELFSQQL